MVLLPLCRTLLPCSSGRSRSVRAGRQEVSASHGLKRWDGESASHGGAPREERSPSSRSSSAASLERGSATGSAAEPERSSSPRRLGALRGPRRCRTLPRSARGVRRMLRTGTPASAVILNAEETGAVAWGPRGRSRSPAGPAIGRRAPSSPTSRRTRDCGRALPDHSPCPGPSPHWSRSRTSANAPHRRATHERRNSPGKRAARQRIRAPPCLQIWRRGIRCPFVYRYGKSVGMPTTCAYGHRAARRPHREESNGQHRS